MAATTQLQPIFATATAANIASVTANINTIEKYTGKAVLDTTNSRLMIALGANANSNWAVADGSATVTPS